MSSADIAKHLAYILKSEHITSLPNTFIEKISSVARGDIRSAINTLQFLLHAYNPITTTTEDMLHMLEKDVWLTNVQAVSKMMSPPATSYAELEQMHDIDPLIMPMIVEDTCFSQCDFVGMRDITRVVDDVSLMNAAAYAAEPYDPVVRLQSLLPARRFACSCAKTKRVQPSYPPFTLTKRYKDLCRKNIPPTTTDGVKISYDVPRILLKSAQIPPKRITPRHRRRT
jgi:hypothetical protein